jgi:hypothetical protein
MICAQAKTTAKRDKAIEGVIAKHPELESVGFELGMYSYVNWMTEDDQTILQIEVRDESKSERLASELRACGRSVNVMTEQEYQAFEFGETVGGANGDAFSNAGPPSRAQCLRAISASIAASIRTPETSTEPNLNKTPTSR